MEKIGYARVSTVEQSLLLQRQALEVAGCSAIYFDQGVSGKTTSRPGLTKAMRDLSAGDTLVVWRLDRLGRSLVHLVGLVNDLATNGIEFQSLTESIDTNSCGGRLVFHMMAALAEFERNLISERTRAGMRAMKAAGRHIGRPKALTEIEQMAALTSILEDNEPLSDVAARYRVHPRTIRRLLSSV